MNLEHLNKEYYCVVCKNTFTMKEDLLDEVHLKHECGEELSIVTCSCPLCESMMVVEGMNQIAWIMPENENLS